ncbi:MAG: hypothetical protein IJA35_07540 [Clostridia bacterium]|nr:hypothetical protein [Clostridia bacterium]
MKKLLCLLVALMMCAISILAAGCNITATQDPNTVIASIGERELTLGVYEQTFEMYANMYSVYYSQNVYSDKATLEAFQETIFDMMVGTICALHMGDELNLFDYTEEQTAELQSRIDEELISLVEYHEQSAIQEFDSLGEDYTDEQLSARVEELIAEEGAHFLGEGCTRQEYETYLTDMIIENYQLELVEAAVLKDVTVDDAIMHEEYDLMVAADKETYEDDPGSYKDDAEYFEAYPDSGYRPYYTPEGYFRIMHIFTTAESAIDTEYTELEARLSEIKSEYGELALSDAINETSENAEALALLLDEYEDVKHDMDRIYSAHFGDALDKIEEAYEKLERGVAFEEVLSEYTEDADFVNTEYFMEHGMLISSYESYTDWSDLIKEEFSKLSIGEYSEIFSDSTGYHIIYYLEDVSEGPVSYDAVKDELYASLLESIKSDEWDALIEEWLNSSDLNADIESVRHVGADKLPDEVE